VRMPAYLDPISEEEITQVAEWIDAGCPEA
jgi:hypothetical protein